MLVLLKSEVILQLASVFPLEIYDSETFSYDSPGSLVAALETQESSYIIKMHRNHMLVISVYNAKKK